MTQLNHLNTSGAVVMIDVGHKPETHRVAVAAGRVIMRPETVKLMREGDLKKGDALAVARIAGIMAAKQTADLIPLCHPLPITHIEMLVTIDDQLPGVSIEARVETSGRTGVEMEALTAVSVAALAIYDMAKSAEHSIRITDIRLKEKHGGQSGDLVLD